MGMPVSHLDGSPFSDYLIPGLILLLVLGVLPLVAAAGLWVRRSWAWYVAFAVGCGLMIWILVEITIIPYDPLQIVFGVIGALIVLVSLTASVRRASTASPCRAMPDACRPGFAPTGAGRHPVSLDDTGSCRLVANMPMHREVRSQRELSVRTQTTSRQRVFPTPSPPATSSVYARSRHGCGRTAPWPSTTASPASPLPPNVASSASLLARLRRCTGALCLYGSQTFEDAWVRLGARDRRGAPPARLRRRLVG